RRCRACRERGCGSGATGSPGRRQRLRTGETGEPENGSFPYYGSMSATRLVLNEPQAMRFEINRAALVEQRIFEAEREKIFERCWLYVGHESEVQKPGDFRTRSICGRPILF